MTAGDGPPGLPVQYVVGARLADGAAAILNDPELTRLVEAWPALPAAVRAAIAGLMRARRPAELALASALDWTQSGDTSEAGRAQLPGRPDTGKFRCAGTEIGAGADAADVDAPVSGAHASEIIRTVELELDAVQSEPAADVPRRQQ